MLTTSIAFAVEYHDGECLSTDFVNAKLGGSSFRDATCSSRISFENCALNGAVFDGAVLNSRFWGCNLLSASFVGADLSVKLKDEMEYTSFQYSRLQYTDFTNANLSHVSFRDSYAIAFANFDNATITYADFSNTGSLTYDNLSAKQLYSTRSYYWEKNLTGVEFGSNDLSSWNFSGQNLQNSGLSNANVENTNFSHADLRGSSVKMTASSISKTANTIWKNGEIKNLTMRSLNDYLTIRKYVPTTEGGVMINAKIVDDVWITGGARLTLEEGAVLEISAGETVTVYHGEIVFDVDAAADDTNIILNSGSKLVFGDNSKLTINLTGEVSETDPLHFTVIKAADDSYVLGLDTLPKDNIILNVNGTAYDSSKWGINFDPTTGTLDISVNVPEPATCAVALGALAIAFALMRKTRKGGAGALPSCGAAK